MAAAKTSPQSRSRWYWVRWAIAAVIVAVLIVEAYLLWPSLADVKTELLHLHWGWLLGAILAQLATLSAYGRVQKLLLAQAEVHISQLKSVSLVYSSTAMSLTLPAGQVFGTAFTYRTTRKWGATPVVASWQLAMSGVLAAASLAVLGMGGAMLVGSTVNPTSTIFAIVGLAGLLYLTRYVSQNPRSMEEVGRWVLRGVNWMRSKPATHGLDRWRRILGQLESVELGPKPMSLAFGWSMWKWVSDALSLGLAALAVGTTPAISSLVIAFVAGKAVASIPFAPGGLLFVDGALIATLVGGGMPASQAMATVVVYRLISFALVAIIGWIVFLVLYRATAGPLDSDLDLQTTELDDFHRRQAETEASTGGPDPPEDGPPGDGRPDTSD